MQIAQREACVTVSYADDTLGGDARSLGFGSQSLKPKVGDTITLDQAWVLLRQDIAKRDVDIAKYLTRPVSQWEWDALASLYFQAGTDALKDVCAAYNRAHNYEHAIPALQFAQWAHGRNPVTDEGHAKRRIREMAIAEFGEYGNLSTYLVFDGNPKLVAPRAVPFPPEPA